MTARDYEIRTVLDHAFRLHNQALGAKSRLQQQALLNAMEAMVSVVEKDGYTVTGSLSGFTWEKKPESAPEEVKA